MTNFRGLAHSYHSSLILNESKAMWKTKKTKTNTLYMCSKPVAILGVITVSISVLKYELSD